LVSVPEIAKWILDNSLRINILETQSAPQRFVAVEVASPRSATELTVLLSSGLRIEVKRGFDILTLRQLVAGLEA